MHASQNFEERKAGDGIPGKPMVPMKMIKRVGLRIDLRVGFYRTIPDAPNCLRKSPLFEPDANYPIPTSCSIAESSSPRAKHSAINNRFHFPTCWLVFRK